MILLSDMHMMRKKYFHDCFLGLYFFMWDCVVRTFVLNIIRYAHDKQTVHIAFILQFFYGLIVF